MAPPRLAAEQINCGPFFTTQQIEGRWISKATPYGDYDLSHLAKELPEDQQPDVVVCHVDCSFGLKPRNVRAFRCPVVLFAADSHWGDRALSEMVRYAASEPFDRVIVLYDRHHIPFYRAAGIKNVHWLPGFTFAHSDDRVTLAAGEPRKSQLGLVGKAGFHFRRQRLFAAMIDAKLPLAWKQVRQSEVIAHYAGSTIGLNVAMNGDLNLRVFETIAGGAMLLTDRLSPDAGLDELLREGVEKVSYENANDLIEKARHYLSRPDEALRIGAAGRRWFDEHFSEQRRQSAFRDLVFSGKERAEFVVPEKQLVQFDWGSSKLSFAATLAAYDVLNELHRQQERVIVRADASVPALIERIAATLPRVSIVREGDGLTARADLAIRAAGNMPVDGVYIGQRYWVWDLPAGTLGSTRAKLEGAGLQLLRPDGALFFSAKPPVTAVQTMMVEARRYLEAGDLQGSLTRAKALVAQAPRMAEPYLILAEVALEAGNRDLFQKVLANARKAEPDNPGVSLLSWAAQNTPIPWQPSRLLAMTWKAVESLDFEAAEKYARRTLQIDPGCASACYAMAVAASRLAEASPGAAAAKRAWELESLKRAVELAPKCAEYSFALAVAFLREKRPAEAAKMYQSVLELNPSEVDAWFGLGIAHSEQGNMLAAVDAFSAGLTRYPDHAGMQLARSRAQEFALRCAAPFPEAIFAAHAERTDCPETTLDRSWKNTLCTHPSLACVPVLARDRSIPTGEALRIVMLAFESAVRTTNSLQSHDVPSRTVLFGFQPWFGLDARELISAADQTGTLLVLIDGEPSAIGPEPLALNAENYRSLVHRGVHLWQVCHYRISVHLRILPKDFDPRVPAQWEELKALYRAAVHAIDQANSYCEFYRPESIVVAQGYDVVAAALRAVGLQRGLRVVAIENTFHRERLLWDDISGIAVNVNQAKNYYWRYRDAVNTETAAATVDAYLQSMPSLKSVEHTSPSGIGIASDSAKNTITYIGQVGVDSSVLFGLRGFPSQVDVIAALAAYAAERDCRLLIKLHPKESPTYPDPVPYYRRLTAGWLEQHEGFQRSRQKLGADLVLDEDNRFDTYEMIRTADVCVTVTSQAGLEALLLNKEVVLCGAAYYGGLGFTHEAEDEASLRFQLDRVLQGELRRNNAGPRNAFFHIFTELYCLPKTDRAMLGLIERRPPYSQVESCRPCTGKPAALLQHFDAVRSQRDPENLLILGGAGHGNLGDEALLLSAVQSARAAMPDCKVIVATPDEMVTRQTLGSDPAALVAAPRVCFFRADRDSSYWEFSEVFVARWRSLKDFLLGHSQASVFEKIRAGKGPEFVDARGALALLNAVSSADAIILHGGGILCSATRSRLWDCALLATLAAHWGKPLLLRSQQLGPVDNAEDGERLKDILMASASVSVRDRIVSRDVATELAGRLDVVESPDDAFFAQLTRTDVDGVLSRHNLRSNAYIAVSYRRNARAGIQDTFIEDFISVCSQAAKLFAVPLLLVPMTDADEESLSVIHERLGHASKRMARSSDVWERVAILENARLVVSLPHHPLIFALRGGVPVLSPVLGEYYRHKNVGSMAMFGCEQNVIAHSGDSEKFLRECRVRLEDLVLNESQYRARLTTWLTELRSQRGEAERKFWSRVPATKFEKQVA